MLFESTDERTPFDQWNKYTVGGKMSEIEFYSSIHSAHTEYTRFSGGFLLSISAVPIKSNATEHFVYLFNHQK